MHLCEVIISLLLSLSWPLTLTPILHTHTHTIATNNRLRRTRIAATVAVKETDLRGLPMDVQEILRREAVILDVCDHPNIVRLFQVKN